MSVISDRPGQQRALLAAIASDETEDARLFARRMRHRAEIERLWDDVTETGPEEFGMLELAGTARIGQTRASTQLSDGTRLVQLFGASLKLLEAGVMFRETAVLLLQLTRNCAEHVQVEVEARVLSQIATANTTDVRRIVTATIPEVEADLDPELTKERLERGRRDRRVWISPSEDGMCQVGAQLEVIRGRRWSLDFEELVRAQKIADERAGIVRTQDQRRADVFAELPGRLRALISAIQQGKTSQLLALARQTPDRADKLASAAGCVAAGENPAMHAAAVSTSGEVGTHDPPGLDEVLERLTRMSIEELTIEVLRLPVRDPRVLNVHIPMTTLLDVDHRSGYLEGHGPIPAEQARLLVPSVGLRRLFVDGASGVPIGIDPIVHPALLDEDGQVPTDVAQFDELAATVRNRLLAMLGPVTVAHEAESRHDPSAALTRIVEVRDMGCIGIGCSCPPQRCHKDHELRYPDGPTAAWNLSSKSARCHRAKHAGWTVTRLETGQVSWTSPLGHSYSRPGVWRAPRRLPSDVTLAPARLAQRGDHDPWPYDAPLWNEPEPAPDTSAPQAHGGWTDDPAF